MLLEDAAIRAAAVIAVEGEGAARVAASVAGRLRRGISRRASNRNRLLANLGARLPAYMVPAFLDVLEIVPDAAQRQGRSQAAAEAAGGAGAHRSRDARAQRRAGGGSWPTYARGCAQRCHLDRRRLLPGAGRLLAAGGAAGVRSCARSWASRWRSATSTITRRSRRWPRTVQAWRAARTRASSGRERARVDGWETTSLARSSPRGGAGAAAVHGCAGAGPVPAIYAGGGAGVLGPALRTGGLAPGDGCRWARWIGLSLLVVTGVWPALLLLSIAAKWVLIGRYRPGAYPLRSGYYLRFWLARRFQLISVAFLTGTPFMALYLRAMGARIGAAAPSRRHSSPCSICCASAKTVASARYRYSRLPRPGRHAPHRLRRHRQPLLHRHARGGGTRRADRRASWTISRCSPTARDPVG